MKECPSDPVGHGSIWVGRGEGAREVVIVDHTSLLDELWSGMASPRSFLRVSRRVVAIVRALAIGRGMVGRCGLSVVVWVVRNVGWGFGLFLILYLYLSFCCVGIVPSLPPSVITVAQPWQSVLLGYNFCVA